MPLRLERVCKQYGCGQRTGSLSGYCEAHEHSNDEIERRRAYDAERNKSPHRRFYGTKAWANLRTWQLSHFPMCADFDDDGSPCRNGATVVHHLKDHAGDWRLFIDAKNLQSLCKRHHDAITLRRNNERRKQASSHQWG
jgi:hypothetical protein